MHPGILSVLRCPSCKGPLEAGAEPGTGATCPHCGAHYSTKQNVLHLAGSGVPKPTARTVSQFGASWQIHDHLADYQRRQLQDWMAPMELGDLSGRRVLEAGCGKGRHSVVLASFAPKELLSVDLSEAIYLAARNTANLDNVTCVRADLLDLPVEADSMDVVVCLGVLHHLENPLAGLRELWRVLRPGGTLCLWVYAREGNGWVVSLVDPIRKGITSRIPTKLLRPLLLPLSSFLYVLLKFVYGPSTRKGAKRAKWLPYSLYLGYISKFPFREIEHIVLDHLCPPIAYYLSRPTLETWFDGLEPAEIHYRWHNRNSWTVVARKSSRGETA